MLFGDLIKVMRLSKVFSNLRDKIAIDLLNAAGITLKDNQSLETTVTKWIDRKLPDNMIAYFPDERVNDVEVLKYIKRWTTGDKWLKLQKEFLSYDIKAEKNQKAKSIVDCGTEDREKFCRSVLTQVIVSLRLPLPDENIVLVSSVPCSEAKSEIRSSEKNASPDKTQSVHELTLPEQPVFSEKTIKAMKNRDPSKAHELFKSIRDDLTRPLTPIKKE